MKGCGTPSGDGECLVCIPRFYKLDGVLSAFSFWLRLCRAGSIRGSTEFPGSKLESPAPIRYRAREMSHQPDNIFAGTQVVSLVEVRGTNNSLVHFPYEMWLICKHQR
jgi:hypothetical protein